MPKKKLEWISAWHSKLCTECYRCDVWSFAICAFGGCGDTAFRNFVCWIPWQGKEFFDAIINEPDSLVSELKKYTRIGDETLGLIDLTVARERFGDDFQHPFQSRYPKTAPGIWVPEKKFPEVFPDTVAAFGERWLYDNNSQSYNAIVRAAKKREKESRANSSGNNTTGKTAARKKK